jgi:hypothetical protein
VIVHLLMLGVVMIAAFSQASGSNLQPFFVGMPD